MLFETPSCWLRKILGGTWRRICSLGIRSVRALEVLRNRDLQIDIYLLTYLFAALTASRGDTKNISVSQIDVAEEDHAFSSLDYSSVSCYDRHLEADQPAVYDSRVALSCPDLSNVDHNDDRMSDTTTAAVASGYVAAKITRSRSFESLTSSTLADRVNSFNAEYDRQARIGWQRHHCWQPVSKHSVASLGWVTPGAATEGVTLYFFLKKNWRPFLLITVTFYWFHSGVTPLEACVTLHL